ncbi:hypothetical protein WJX81_003037 [Elliptochloris bilobata]|uniref:Steroid 5-alpha reductase C-terminal domain-containing protein n=1 Tax=Elliptochloris bilobata TaxID=381761 RepID=A0AAW1QWM0_9CHLO
MNTAIGSLSFEQSALVGTLVVDFAIQLVGWLVSSVLQTDKLYDLLGSTTFIVLAVGTLAYAGRNTARSVIATILVCLWALRLGGFLFFRVLKSGSDSRFDEAKKKPGTFLVYWALQGVWVWVTLLPVIIVNSSSRDLQRVLWTDVVGLALWVLGFILEVTADFQKYAFKQIPANKGRFIDTGVYKFARYPQYGGEILVWLGVWLFCTPVFQGADWASVVSPVCVASLLLFVSGVPIQERQAQERWGADPAYQAWRARAWLLFPLGPRWWTKQPGSTAGGGVQSS